MVWIGRRGASWIQDGESSHIVMSVLSDENYIQIGAPKYSVAPTAPSQTPIIERWVESDMQIVRQCVNPTGSVLSASNLPVVDLLEMLDWCSAL